MIKMGMIKVDGKVISSNVPISDNNYLQIGTSKAIRTPSKPDTRIWAYHKPRETMCTRWDSQKRPTIFHHLAQKGLNLPHIIAVGRLDYLSEGVILLTNDGDLSRALELPSNQVERTYRVRVFGRRFNEKKLDKLRRGFRMRGRKYGPYVVEIIKRQTSNTWLHMKLYEGKNNEIRRVMRKFSLRVNRLIRQSYGPYTLGLVPNPNDLAEVRITKGIRKLMNYYYKEKALEAQERLSKQKAEEKYLESKKKEKLQIENEKESESKKISERYFNLDDLEDDAPKGLGERLLRDTK